MRRNAVETSDNSTAADTVCNVWPVVDSESSHRAAEKDLKPRRHSAFSLIRRQPPLVFELELTSLLIGAVFSPFLITSFQ